MFTTLYRCARTAARHENGPAARSRVAYLEHLAAGGAALHCLRAKAGVLYRAAVSMNLDDASPLERTAVESAARDWAHRRYFNAMASGPEGTATELAARQILGECNRLISPRTRLLCGECC